MKILFVVNGFPPTENAGTEIVAWQQARALRALGHDVAVFARGFDRSRPNLSVHDERHDGFTIRRFTSHGPGGNDDDRGEAVCAAFDAFLQQAAPDLVHIHHLIGLAPEIAPTVRASGKALVVTLHDFWFGCPRIHLWRQKRERCDGPEGGLACHRFCDLDLGYSQQRYARMMTTIEHADEVVSDSRFVAATYARWGLTAPVTAIAPGAEIAPAQLAPPGEAGPLRLGYVGSLIEEKGAHLLVQAVRGFPESEVVGTSSGDPTTQPTPTCCRGWPGTPLDRR
ncbi:MAG: glycosyltransferase [Dehalococcoidia bacterium]|nr:glycosyltransferase [Dehalococcoidia bacterium]